MSETVKKKRKRRRRRSPPLPSQGLQADFGVNNPDSETGLSVTPLLSVPKPLLRIRAARWKPSNFEELGRGGEAIVYRLRADTAAKVFLLPTAPEFADSIQLQEAARARIIEMQTKLFDFPSGLPEQIVVPTGVLENDKRQIFGYTMPFVEGFPLDKLTRTTSILNLSMIGNLLVSLYDLLTKLHERGVVVGDLNENNIIIAHNKTHLIDADSMQFGSYQCRTFVPRCTAPELLAAESRTDPGVEVNGSFQKKKPKFNPLEFAMVAPHSQLTDWYSFLVIAMRMLIFTDPYGGVGPTGMDLLQRMKERVTIFDRRVIYPRVARPLTVVPRPVLELFVRFFHLGERFVPAKEVFETLTARGERK